MLNWVKCLGNCTVYDSVCVSPSRYFKDGFLKYHDLKMADAEAAEKSCVSL